MRTGIILLFLLGLAACGVKGDPVAPGGSSEENGAVVR